MEKEKRKTKEQGITLIALVITIIVLLILAGVSIAMLTGDNGILTQAQNAQRETDKAKEDELRRLTALEAVTNLENTTYRDKNGQTATIPAGFAVSQVEGENTINNGLVIIDANGNEFVWIPVETPVSDTEANGTNNKAMAIKVGDNYRGLLYDFTSSDSTVISGCTTTSNSYREPDIVQDTDEDTTYNNGLFTKDSLQQDYNEMIESVEQYNGFYVGRYELGLEGDKPVSKNASTNTDVITTDANNSNTSMWYGLYAKCKEFAPQNSDKSVVSSMIWGSQYDAMENWMQKNGIDVKHIGEWNSTTITGNGPSDVIKNIFDLYGCHMEWTLEAYDTQSRVRRGGYSGNGATTYRTTSTSSSIGENDRSSRLTLYIK